MSGKGCAGASPSLAIFSSFQLKNSQTATFSWLLLRHVGVGRHHVYHQPAHRQALNDALTASRLFVCSLKAPTSPGRYLFISYYDITNLERSLPIPLQYAIINTVPHYAEQFPSLIPQHQTCPFDATSPTSAVSEGTLVSEVSLHSPNRNVTTAHQPNPR